MDDEPRSGRFLLMDSAHLMILPQVADSLAGRMKVIRLLPLSRAEIAGRRSDFIDIAFAWQRPEMGVALVGPDLVNPVLEGELPETLTRTRWSRRQDWYLWIWTPSFSAMWRRCRD